MNSDLKIAFEVTLKVIAIFIAIALFVPFILGVVFWLVKHCASYYHWVYSLFGAQNYFN